MKVYNQGVRKGSEVYFHTRSAQAKAMFFYPLCVGHYLCDGTYHVRRASYNSFLVLYVVRGSGYILAGGAEQPLSAGQFALLDCYAPHGYGTHTEWEIYWLHFDGVLCRDYYRACTAQGCVFAPANSQAAAYALTRIFEDFDKKRAVNEAVISRRITDLLTELLCAGGPVSEGRPGVSDAVMAYISENLDRPLTVEQMARHVSLSPYHFSRLFRQETGFSPHEYLLRTRISMAKYLLRGSGLSVKVIAFRCGFAGESSFCTAFKRLEGVTPAGYRSENLP